MCLPATLDSMLSKGQGMDVLFSLIPHCLLEWRYCVNKYALTKIYDYEFCSEFVEFYPFTKWIPKKGFQGY